MFLRIISRARLKGDWGVEASGLEVLCWKGILAGSRD